MKKNTTREIKKNPSWYDRAQYSKIWLVLFQRVAEFRAKGERSKCKDAIDTLILMIFKSERDVVKNYIKELDDQFKNPTKSDVDKKYDLILEKIVDVLEESRWLTREGTSTMMEEGHEGFEEEDFEKKIEEEETIEDFEKIEKQDTIKDSAKKDVKKSVFGKRRRKYQV